MRDGRIMTENGTILEPHLAQKVLGPKGGQWIFSRDAQDSCSWVLGLGLGFEVLGLGWLFYTR